MPLLFAALLPVFAAAGCASLAPRSGEPPVATVPHFERLDVGPFAADPHAVNRLLSERARAYAAGIGCDAVWYGDGLSMEPLIARGSWIVTRPCAFADLRPGMVVLYTAATGRPVAHALVRRTTRGWLVAGVNNPSLDPGFVTPANLAGVIAAVFTPSGTRPLP